MRATIWEAGAAALLLAIAGYCLLRVAVAAGTRRPDGVDVDCGHVAMGVAMAAMLEPAIAPVHGATVAAEVVVFAGLALWFLVPGRGGHLGMRQLDHAAGGGAMVVMLTRPGRAMPGMGLSSTSASPLVVVITVALAGYLLLGAGRSLAHVRRERGPYTTRRTLADHVLAAPWQAGCEAVMAVAMAVMLAVAL